jgi:hypothetical protein
LSTPACANVLRALNVTLYNIGSCLLVSKSLASLAGFLRDRAEPDRRLASEAALVQRVGGWIGEQVLGEQVGRAMMDRSPVVVR